MQEDNNTKLFRLCDRMTSVCVLLIHPIYNTLAMNAITESAREILLSLIQTACSSQTKKCFSKY